MRNEQGVWWRERARSACNTTLNEKVRKYVCGGGGRCLERSAAGGGGGGGRYRAASVSSALA